MQNGQVAKGVAAVKRETEGRTRAAEHFMSELDWDLLVVVYSLPDVWQHYYWRDLEEARESTGRDLIHGGYELMDRHLSRLLEHLPPDGLVILCSDHGFGPLCSTRDHLNRWLVGLGYHSKHETGEPGLTRRLAGTLFSQLRRQVSFRRRQQIMASIPALRRTVETRLRIGNIDWEYTQVYAALDHQELWLNLQGRQPQGCVPPERAESLGHQLKTDLLAWRDDSTGLNIIDAVHLWPYAQARVSGSLAPDLFLEWNPSTPQQALHPLISGDHNPEGTLIAAGPGIRSGLLEDCSLIDVAPLALRALGVAAPKSMDGQVPFGIFDGVG
jgi:predicted AlkP superfamily phosphohydrolase/phosphomutase